MNIAHLGISNPAGTALYKTVKRRIIDSIHHGEWKAGKAIPSERKLCDRFGVSMGTLRKAVDELSSEGVLIRQQGRGTYVATHNRERYLFSFFHVVHQDGHKEYPKVELDEVGYAKADSYAVKVLGVDLDSRLFRFVNRLALGGKPVLIDEILLPEKLFPGIDEKKLRERPGTLYQLYQDTFGIAIISTRERLRAVSANPVKARLLGVKEGCPLLQIIRVAFSFKAKPVELRYSYVFTQNYEYSADPISTS